MEALFEQICNLSISASWLILATFAVRFLLRKAPKKYICALWLLVGIRLVFPFSIESALSLVPAVDVSVISKVTEEKQFPVQIETAQGDYQDIPTVNAGFQTNDFVVSFFRLKRKLSWAVNFQENVWQSEYVDSPFIFGIIRPRIYIPYQLPEESLEYVIAHENVHIKRKDHWVKVIAFLILSVYWFHPLVWLSYKYLCKDVEMACDEQVVAVMNEDDRKAYSLALLSCYGKKTWYYACPVGFGEVNVKERVVRVLNYRKPSFWLALLVFLLCIVLAVCFLTSAKTEEQKETPLLMDGRVDFGDLDNNGQIDYYIYEAGEDENYHGQMTIYMNDEAIYTYKSEWEIFEARAKYEDLDGDRRKELFVSWEPRVNSMPLMEYFVLDKTVEGWKELEMIHGENVHDNAFPITMNYGIHQDILEIDTAVCHREIDGEYIDQTCLIATHGLQGPAGKNDFLGNLHIYFIYDSEGKVQILDMKLGEGEVGTIHQEHMIAAFPEKQVWVYYDEWVDGIYKGIRVSRGIYKGSTYYEWYFDAHIADYYYSPEVSLLHGGEHLFIKFTQGKGSGIFETEAHILDLETMKEIPIESPDEVISETLKKENAKVGFGAISKYGTKDDSLTYTTSLQESITEITGYLKLQYEYREGSYQVDAVQYQQEENEQPLMDESGNQVRKAAYEEAIQRLCEEKVFPDGRFDIRFSGEIPKGNGYLIEDIDGDGQIELLLNCANAGSYGDDAMYIFDYDVEQKQFHKQFGGFPNVTLYQNGIILERASHNHGNSVEIEDFWPYTVYQYQNDTDTYEAFCHVDGWEKDFYPNGFPDEKDLDGDGVLYSLNHPDTNEHMAEMDRAEYEVWSEGLVREVLSFHFDFEELRAE